MFFNQGFIDGRFDSDAIQNFYDLLSAKIDGVEIAWRHKTSSVIDSMLADNVIITHNGENIFKMNSNKDRGFLNLKNIEGYEDAIYNSLVDSGLMYTGDKPSFGMPALYSIGHIMLLALLISHDSMLATFVWGSLALLLASAAFMYIILTAHLGSGLRIVASVLSLLGFIALAPGSLLQVSLFTTMNRRYLYNEIKKAYTGEVILD